MGKGWGWANGWGLAALIAGLSLVVWWVRQSLASPNPLIAVRSFSNRTIAVGCAVTALVSMWTLPLTVFFSLLMQYPFWEPAGLGFSAALAGVAKLHSTHRLTLDVHDSGRPRGQGRGR